MADFINTIDVLGDDAVIDSIINRTITEFKDDKLTTIGYSAFRSCTALTTVDAPNVTTVAQNVFEQCTALKEVNLPLLASCTETWTQPQYTFQQCKSLTRIVLPKLKSIGYAMFYGCGSLEYVDFSALSHIQTGISWMQVFGDCSALTAIVLRTETLVTLNSAALHSTAYIYVPRALVDSYKTATNWSTFADQFRALEDYTVDGTTTGALDETKI